MRISTKVLTGLGIFVLAVGLSACGVRSKDADGSASLVLRTYTVPDGRAKDLSKTLNNVLGTGKDKNQLGRTWFSGPGQLLVLAPQRMQDSIASSIKEMTGKNPDTAASPQPLRLDAWVVDAYPGQGPADPSLAAIQPALAAFSKVMGQTHFSQAQYLTAVSDIGSWTVLMPSPGQHFTYRLMSSGSGLVLKFVYHDDYRYPVGHGYAMSTLGLEGQTVVQQGHTLVLGLISELPSGKSAGSKGSTVVHKLLVVRITSANQG